MDVQRAASLSRRLRERGLRATSPRIEVLATLEDLGGHRSADEVLDHLGAADRRLPRSSVYNILTSLVAAGLALTADAGPGAVLYEAGREAHHHFLCRRCRRVIDVPCITGSTPCLAAGTDVGTIEQAQVVFRGVCSTCLAGVTHP